MEENNLIHKNLTELKLGSYSTGNATSLTDVRIVPKVQNYKRQTASRMFPLGKSDINRKIPEAEYLVSRKIDGEFTVLVWRDGQILTANPGGTVRVGLPFLEEAKSLLTAAGIKSAMIAGELYVTNTENRRPRVHDVVSVARTPKVPGDLDRIQFAVFDLIEIEDEPVDQDYRETWSQIEKVFAKGDKIHPVETLKLKGHRDLENQFRAWVEDEGAEGIVVRSDTAGTFKIKPRHTLDAVVIGFTESTDDRQGMLHDLLLGIARTDGSVHILGRVGGGFSDDNRREMLSDLQDMVVESEYAEVNSDHVAYQMVRPEWVVEISCLDLIAQNTRGGAVNRMVIKWNESEKRYDVVRRLPLVSVISPQFIRVREDKSFNVSDVRISQITDLVPVSMSEVVASEMTLPKSEVISREVYTKVLRGETMVRKFLMWQTNKQGESEEYPGFVIHYTDYSPSRKVPLNREVRVTNSKTQLLALWAGFKDEYIKKGWNLHSKSGDVEEKLAGEKLADAKKDES